ncbi:MAG: hypothetical protein CSA49_02965 [Gammaproteobacteria bacterium]|nr:MAG: hypothetical protein CSA49_02965 [Gammaproteobacteria bacterium]
MKLVLNETMQGWIELNETRKAEAFEFTIKVGLGKGSRLLGAQPFAGIARLTDRDYQTPVEGELTFQLSGPKYQLDFEFPGIGLVRASGEKSYSMNELVESLVTCPLTVYAKGEIIGYAEVRYQGPIITFPLKAIRLESDNSAVAAN